MVRWALAFCATLLYVGAGCTTGEDLFTESSATGASSSGGAGPGGAGAGAGNQGGAVTTGGNGAGGIDPPPPVCSTEGTPSGDCDPICDSCDAGNCTIQCNAGSPCLGETIDCPPGLFCTVNCSEGACRGTIINCPDAFQCTTFCNGDQTCRDLALNCAPEAVCKLACNQGDDVCRDAYVNCDNNWCIAECPNGANPQPNINCDEAGGCPCGGCDG